ncbi:hypothetical protein [uncultured Deinococcus sp.]|uniref:hypothetical protein n=1 Tax=uncultured Deinococcus sp. TaxID=158789 RepID=UPI0025D70415|nr:hypothetical protein [uncultured Deinococcus sp.]
MATKKDNAEQLHKLLGVTIDPEASTPKADALQAWVTRAATEPDAVKREILSGQLEARLGIELTDATLSAEQLSAWLAQADTDEPGVRAALAAAQGDPDSGTLPVVAPVPTPDTVIVSVNATIAGYGGTFTDPDQEAGAQIVGTDATEVALTPRVQRGLREGTLTEHTED